MAGRTLGAQTILFKENPITFQLLPFLINSYNTFYIVRRKVVCSFGRTIFCFPPWKSCRDGLGIYFLSFGVWPTLGNGKIPIWMSCFTRIRLSIHKDGAANRILPGSFCCPWTPRGPYAPGFWASCLVYASDSIIQALKLSVPTNAKPSCSTMLVRFKEVTLTQMQNQCI